MLLSKTTCFFTICHSHHCRWGLVQCLLLLLRTIADINILDAERWRVSIRLTLAALVFFRDFIFCVCSFFFSRFFYRLYWLFSSGQFNWIQNKFLCDQKEKESISEKNSLMRKFIFQLWGNDVGSRSCAVIFAKEVHHLPWSIIPPYTLTLTPFSPSFPLVSNIKPLSWSRGNNSPSSGEE